MGKNKRKNKKNLKNIDTVHYPIFWNAETGTSAITTTKTLTSQFDRNRAFRVSQIKGEASSTDFPVIVQIEVFGPETPNDNIWSSKPFMIPTGVVRRFNFRIPKTTNLWLPAEVASTFPLFRANFICIDKTRVGKIIGNLLVSIQLRPLEVDYSCPKLMIQPNVSTEAKDFEVV